MRPARERKCNCGGPVGVSGVRRRRRSRAPAGRKGPRFGSHPPDRIGSRSGGGKPVAGPGEGQARSRAGRGRAGPWTRRAHGQRERRKLGVRPIWAHPAGHRLTQTGASASAAEGRGVKLAGGCRTAARHRHVERAGDDRRRRAINQRIRAQRSRRRSNPAAAGPGADPHGEPRTRTVKLGPALRSADRHCEARTLRAGTLSAGRTERVVAVRDGCFACAGAWPGGEICGQPMGRAGRGGGDRMRRQPSD